MGEVRSTVVVDGVAKRFDLQQARTGSLRELLARRQKGEARPETDFWALENVSFTVEPGHPLAIIGHNGSGKSTLLKLLTGILKPTRGTIDVRGRVGALIEVGAGFHPDLTGRENVFLNGSILGASRREMEARFDRIVGFAGLERFIDTPVKRYSTGMYMRLGFAIAAHLDPEILLIDEVLAVGDAQFQNRCLTYLKDYVGRGGSVVFVSHVMGQVRELCDRVVWLDRGQMMGFGEAGPLIERYEALVVEREDAEFAKLYPEEWERRERERADRDREARLAELLARRDALRARRAASRQERQIALERLETARVAALSEFRRAEEERLRSERDRLRAFEASWHDAEKFRREEELRRVEAARVASDPTRFRLLGAELLGPDGAKADSLSVGDSAVLRVRYRAGRHLVSPVIGIDFLRIPDGLHLYTVSNFDFGVPLGATPCDGAIEARIERITLGHGRYRVRLTAFPESANEGWHRTPEDIIESALEFSVDAGRFANGCAWMPIDWKGVAS